MIGGMRRLSLFVLLAAILLSASGYWLYQRPLPVVKAQVIIPQSTVSDPINLPWPSYGQAALGAVGHGVLDSNNTSKAVPVASIAKTITALAVLKEKPLDAGRQGPIITFTESDAQLYRDYLAINGSVVPVNAGGRISQYQALQALMLPSANNIADTLARWAFGSLEDYVNHSNQFVSSLGMKQTTVADASGFSPRTVSTAEDLVILAEAALENPVLAEIVNQAEANFPDIGIIRNVNWLLGTDGVIGIKTGMTDEAGGCFLFGAKRSINGRSVTVIGAILGAPERNQAMNDSQRLINASDGGFELVRAVNFNQIVGRYDLPWGGSAEAVTADGIEVLNWKGKNLTTDTRLSNLAAPKPRTSTVGTIKAGRGDGAKSVNVILSQPATSPSWSWRIFR